MYASIHFAVEPCLWEISFLRCVHVRARAHLLALKTRKSCAVGMRNATPRIKVGVVF